jgi:Niemann-Pick C1 protein
MLKREINCIYRAPTQVADATQMHLPCLASYGGPVFPYVALGGYNSTTTGGENYKNAQALVITFVVRNSNNASEQAPAEAWEAKCVERLQN